MHVSHNLTCAAVLAVVCVFAGSAAAQEPFYAKKTITLVVGANPGGGYDTFARAIAPEWSRHIPGNPNFVVQNMPGAGSLVAANHIFNIAAKDGTVVGAINPSLVSDSLLNPERAKFDLRDFNWLGSPVRETLVGVVSAGAPVGTLEALKTNEMIVAGAGSGTVQVPNAAQRLLGLKFRVVAGYQGTRGALLAMERGEVHGVAGITYTSFKSSHQEWLDSGKVRVFAQFGLSRHPDLQGVPLLVDLAETEQQRQALRFVLSYQDLGRPYVAPPGVPVDRVVILRRSFETTMSDPAFLREAEKRRLDVDKDFPKGEELQKLVVEVYATPASVIEHLKAIGLR